MLVVTWSARIRNVGPTFLILDVVAQENCHDLAGIRGLFGSQHVAAKVQVDWQGTSGVRPLSA